MAQSLEQSLIELIGIIIFYFLISYFILNIINNYKSQRLNN